MTASYVSYVKLASSNRQDKTLTKIMPTHRVKRFIFYFVRSVGISEKPKLERVKLAFDILGSPEVCSTPVAQRSSGIAVETRLFGRI